jgi:hypothetical protein
VGDFWAGAGVVGGAMVGDGVALGREEDGGVADALVLEQGRDAVVLDHALLGLDAELAEQAGGVAGGRGCGGGRGDALLADAGGRRTGLGAGGEGERDEGDEDAAQDDRGHGGASITQDKRSAAGIAVASSRGQPGTGTLQPNTTSTSTTVPSWIAAQALPWKVTVLVTGS